LDAQSVGLRAGLGGEPRHRRHDRRHQREGHAGRGGAGARRRRGLGTRRAPGERLEQDRKMILELVANDQPLEQVAATMADAVASHLPGSLCAIRIQVPEDEPIALYPEFPQPLSGALSCIALDCINETLASAPLEKLADTPEW